MAVNEDILNIAIPQLEGFEGFRSHAYPDPLSGGEPWTVGYGATGPDIGPDTVWTIEEANADLLNRCTALCAELDTDLTWWRTLDPVRAAVLLEMAYQMGVEGLMNFHHTLGYIKAVDYQSAATEMLQSRWAQETPNRAHVLARQMLTGDIA